MRKDHASESLLDRRTGRRGTDHNNSAPPDRSCHTDLSWEASLTKVSKNWRLQTHISFNCCVFFDVVVLFDYFDTENTSTNTLPVVIFVMDAQLPPVHRLVFVPRIL